MSQSESGAPGAGQGRDAAVEGPRREFLRWTAIAYVLVNLPFLAFFYDAFNLNDTLYSTSFLFLGQSPYNPAHSATILVGYPLLPYNLGMLGAYGADGLSVLTTAIFLKLLALVATYLAARLLLRIAVREGYTYWKAIYLGFLFNPFLLFVNVIWIETDVFIILAILLGFYLLCYGWSRSADLLGLTAGAITLLAAAFAYFSPILLLPAFIVYSRTLRERLGTGVALVALGLLMAVPFLFFHLTTYTIVGASGGASPNPYSFVQLFVPLGATLPIAVSRSALALVALASIAIPIVLQRFGVHLSVALVTVFSFGLLATPSAVQGDNFVILTGLIPLALIFTKGVRVTWARILLLELFLLPLMWIVEMFNGPGQVSGVYYWSYFLFHQNVDLFQPLGGTLAWRISIVAIAVLLGATVAFLIWRQRVPAGGPGTGAKGPPTSSPASRPRATFGLHGRPLLLGVIVAAVLLLVAPVGWVATPGGFAWRTDGGFPTQLFVVHDYDNPANYLQPSPNTFSVDPAAGELTIASKAPSLVFARALLSQQFDVTLRSTLLTPAGLGVGSPVGIVNASGAEVEFSGELIIPARTSSLSPITSQGFTPVRNPSALLENVSGANQTSGSGIAVYSLSGGAIGGTTLAFAGKMSGSARSQNILWTISTNGTIQLEAYLSGQAFYLERFVQGSWTSESTGLYLIPGNWFYSGISFGAGNDSVTAWVNGVALTFANAWSPSNAYLLNFGKFSPNPSNDGVFAFIGNLTGVFELPTASLSYQDDAIVAYPPSTSPVIELSGTQVNVEYVGASPQARLVVDGESLSVNSSDPSVQIGKIGDSPVALEFTFAHVGFSSIRPAGGALWLVIEFAIAIPGAPFVLLGARHLQRRSERGDPCLPPDPPTIEAGPNGPRSGG
jgi:hypothetical protein